MWLLDEVDTESLTTCWVHLSAGRVKRTVEEFKAYNGEDDDRK